MKQTPLSVVIPTYNRIDSLRRALESVAQQTLCPSEVIVVDDASDATIRTGVATVLQEYRGRLNIITIWIETNRGANYCRNVGAQKAKCRYIAFLDSDDFWFPTKIEIQLEQIEAALKGDTRPVLSATGRYRVSGDGQILARQFSRQAFTLEAISRSNFIGTLSAVIVDRMAFLGIGGFNEALPACQDWELFIRLAKNVQYVGVSEPLCVYVDHSGQRISASNRKRLSALLYLHRTHMQNLSASEKASFYRVVAEDLEGMGRFSLSSKFYSKYLSGKYGANKLASGIISSLLQLFWGDRPLNLKKWRYWTYRRSLLALGLCSPRLNFLKKESEWIKKQMK